MEVVSIQNLSKTYEPDIHAVQGLNLSINQGEIYGFLGPNGAGKSSTIKMIVGLIQPSSGKIELMGSLMKNRRISDILGYVPQELIFYQHLSVLENLRLFASMYEIPHAATKIDSLLELLQIREIKDRRSDTLSGGQKRRLNLALGLLHEPEILILDEPSAGMDPQSRNILWESIRNVADEKQVTIILTTHLMETVDRIADRVGIIDEGKIIAEGTPEELKRLYGNGDILEITFHSQTEFDQDEVLQKLQETYPKATVSIQQDLVKIMMQNIIGDFNDIINLVNSTIGKEQIKSVVIHENTLEDVFIHLTGRALRE